MPSSQISSSKQGGWIRRLCMEISLVFIFSNLLKILPKAYFFINIYHSGIYAALTPYENSVQCNYESGGNDIVAIAFRLYCTFSRLECAIKDRVEPHLNKMPHDKVTLILFLERAEHCVNDNSEQFENVSSIIQA